VHVVHCASWERKKGTMCCVYDTGNGGGRVVVEGEWYQNWSDMCCLSCKIDVCLVLSLWARHRLCIWLLYILEWKKSFWPCQSLAVVLLLHSLYPAFRFLCFFSLVLHHGKSALVQGDPRNLHFGQGKVLINNQWRQAMQMHPWHFQDRAKVLVSWPSTDLCQY